MKIYFILRTQKGYDYEDDVVNKPELRDDYNNNKKIQGEFSTLWNSLFKKSYNKVRKEVKNLSLESVYNANFDKVYLNLDDFYKDYLNIFDLNEPDVYAYFMDDDDFVRSDICTSIKNQYIKGFSGITWNYLRYHGIDNVIYSPNEKAQNFSPWPYIQSNHSIIKLPVEENCKYGMFLEEYGLTVPVHHSCINMYLFEDNSNRLCYNIANTFSLHNTTPASYSFYDHDYKRLGRLKNIFDDSKDFYKNVQDFVYKFPEGNLHLLNDEFKNLIKRQKRIFEECL